MICTYTVTTNRKMHGIWATALLAACLLVAGLSPSTVNAQATCSTLISNNPDLVSDCEALLTAKATLDTTGILNWSAGVAMDTWDGIVLDGTPERVTEIALFRFKMVGTIPAGLSSLTNLQRLDLGNSNLTGSIPTELGDLANLEGLWLDNNALSGSIPADLGDLTNLERLNLSGSGLTGSIPTDLGDLTNLEWLDLSHNNLSGSIPSDLGDLTNLEWMRLNNNSLSGSIPSDLGDLANLEGLYLEHNSLSGSIPSDLGDLTSLGWLDLDNNSLSGSIPPDLGDLANLERLALEHNSLSGSIPSELGDLTNLRWLDLSNNDLSGPVPSELGDLANLIWLELEGNDLCLPKDHQHYGFYFPFPTCSIVSITVSPATTVAHNETVTLTANISDSSVQVDYYYWVRVEDGKRLTPRGLAHQSLTLGGADWPDSAGTWTFKAIAVVDAKQNTSKQRITFTEPASSQPPQNVPQNVSPPAISITTSPSTTVAHTETVTLTATASDPSQVASYLWKRVPNGAHDLSTARSLTLHGHKWPSSAGTRTFRVMVTLLDGSQVAAEQPITFKNPNPAPSQPSQGVPQSAISIAASPSTTVAHTETVTLTASVSDPTQVASYRWAHVGGSQDLSIYQQVTDGGTKVTIGADGRWPSSPGTRTFKVIVTLNDGSEITAEKSIAFTNP